MERQLTTGVDLLAEETWRSLRQAHAERVDPWVEPRRARCGSGRAHPVEDFLFTYYSYRPAALRRWHPGFGCGLVNGSEYLPLKGYGELGGGGVGVSASYVVQQRPLVESTHRLLVSTAERTANFGCFGLHEWAMLYRLDPDQVRHAAWPLRLGAAGTEEVVEGHRVACSHFDAFRFFTSAARPLNQLRPGRDDRPAFEQPACLHAGMDLYKHAFRLSPMVGSDLVADCFELARDIRVLDMRASPYDLTDLGYEPVAIETAEGKQEYTAAQREFTSRGAPVRQRLVEACSSLLSVSSPVSR